MLNALTNVRFWGQSGHSSNRCLPSSIYEYSAWEGLGFAPLVPKARTLYGTKIKI